MILPKTQKEALATGARHYFNGKPCKHGHVEKRYAKHRRCMGCARMWEKIYAERYPEKYAARWAVARGRRGARTGAYARQYRADNREICARRSAEWFKKNPAKARAYARERKAKIKRAMPSWADRRAIAAVYDEAIRLQRLTGVPYDVDHIIPLGGGSVCGLHIHNNLRAIPMTENRRKHNALLEV